jgi:eukaryotic-like serine/threonine-protein kinase
MDVPSSSGSGPLMPQRVGRYEILLPIASGGMATVYLARAKGHGGFEQDVALKLTHAHLRESKEFALDLAEEAKLAARVKHRNVVSIIDVGDDPHGVFLVMEYVEGETLSGLIRRSSTKLPPAAAVRILLDAMAGLHAAHEMVNDEGQPLGLVHRDFSPQNILVGTDGVARLADFGVAKASNRLDQTRTGVVKGKIAYMSPEQARAEPVDRRSDVWAAGVVAWEILAGRRLYQGDDITLLFKVATSTPPRLRSVAPEVSEELDDVVAKALTVDTSLRWPTAAEFARALGAAFRKVAPLDEHDEVAELVKTMAGPTLAGRRAAISKVLSLRKRLGDVVLTAESGMPTPSLPLVSAILEVSVDATGAVATEQATTPLERSEAPPTDTTSVSGPDVPAARSPGTRRRWIAPTLVGALLLLGLGVIVRPSGWPWSYRPSEPTASQPVASTATSPSPSASSQEANVAAADSASATPPGTLPLRVEANAPIVSLRIGGAAVASGGPASSLTVGVAPDLIAAGARIDAVADDGRKASTRLAPAATSARMTFPPHIAPSPNPSPPAPRPSLASDPYRR